MQSKELQPTQAVAPSEDLQGWKLGRNWPIVAKYTVLQGEEVVHPVENKWVYIDKHQGLYIYIRYLRFSLSLSLARLGRMQLEQCKGNTSNASLVAAPMLANWQFFPNWKDYRIASL